MAWAQQGWQEEADWARRADDPGECSSAGVVETVRGRARGRGRGRLAKRSRRGNRAAGRRRGGSQAAGIGQASQEQTREQPDIVTYAEADPLAPTARDVDIDPTDIQLADALLPFGDFARRDLEETGDDVWSM